MLRLGSVLLGCCSFIINVLFLGLSELIVAVVAGQTFGVLKIFCRLFCCSNDSNTATPSWKHHAAVPVGTMKQLKAMVSTWMWML